MVPVYLNQNGYVSCIKIAGLPILPPLVTEDRKKILNEDRAKAVEIENKIKRKRSSIDSGVMTGSYTECLKTGEDQDKENIVPNQLLVSDLICKKNLEYASKENVPESEKITTDIFLQTALEDKEFREFFYNTAERIFNDNNLENTNDSSTKNSSIPFKNASDDMHLAFEGRPSNFTSHTEHFSNMSDSCTDLKPSSEVNIVFSMAGGDHQPELCENLPSVYIEETLSPPQRPVRRNSYTLESPSPVLLEHMAKEFVKNKDESIKWKSLTEKKDCNTNLGFKTFLTVTKPRKTWNKRALNTCPFSKVSSSVGNQPPKASRIHLKKSKTFTKVKSSSENEGTNYSLPCSSSTSPTMLTSFARSVDCVKSAVEKSPNKSGSNSNLNTEFLPKITNEVNSPQCSYSRSSLISESKINKFCGVEDLEPVSKETTTASELNSTLFSECSNNEHNKDILSPAQIEVYQNHNKISNDTHQMLLNDSLPVPKETTMASEVNSISFSEYSNNKNNKDILSPVQREACQNHNQILNDTHQILLNDSLTCAYTNKCKGSQFKTDLSVEADEIISVCSSLSLSKFMPIDETVSRPSSAEEMTTIFSQLQLQHECQIAELLEKQHKEKVMLAMLHSNNGSISSRSTTNMSFFDLSNENSFADNANPEEKKTPCSRELFPSQTSDFRKGAKNLRGGDYSSAKYQEAALKLTAHVRGYLTRRMLKTEKVKQLIDVIKESLNCAFSLQSEAELRRNDLELHKRLENQLTAALNELQSIISAPVTQRMAIIAADREKLRRPPSRPSSAISSATQKSLLRRQMSMSGGEMKPQERRIRAKSFCDSGNPGLVRNGSFAKSDSPVVLNSSSSRKPWR